MADIDTLAVTQSRSRFYQHAYRSVLSVLVFLVVLSLVLLVTLGYLLTHRSPPTYFATTSDGRVLRLYSLDEPVVSLAELLQWATLAATSANTYSFADYQNELAKASVYFTPAGWREFYSALEKSNGLTLVISKKVNVSAVATGAPVVVDQGVFSGTYKWRIQLPMLLTYEGASSKATQAIVVEILVTRVSTLDTPKGIAIDAFYTSGGSISPAAGGGFNL